MPDQFDRKYQVFISSTFSDLARERRDVVDIVVSDQHIPVALERFPAKDRPVSDVIDQVIRQCQIYVVLLGHRYGSIAEDRKSRKAKRKKVGYVELEYDFAMDQKLTVVPLVMDDGDVEELRLELQSVAEKLSRKKKRSTFDDRRLNEIQAELENADRLHRFREKVKKNRFYKPFFRDDREFKYLVGQALTVAYNDTVQPGWIREPENLPVVKSISKNPFLRQIVESLSGLKTLDNRCLIETSKKEALAKCFRNIYLQQLTDKEVSLFFESGSTLASVANQCGGNLGAARLLDENGQPLCGVSTNNVLAHQLLWLCHKIPVTLFPWGEPEETYGASFGCLNEDIHVEPEPEYPPGELDAKAIGELDKLTHWANERVPRWNERSLLLGATSGLQMTNVYRYKEDTKPTAEIESGVQQCRGPHVGSYKNKLFKRFMYQTKHPLMLFLTDDKIDCPIEIGRCHFMMEDKNEWDQFLVEHPLAFCVGCERTKRPNLEAHFQSFGFKTVKKQTSGTYHAFIARNQVFIDSFENKYGIKVRGT